VLCLLLGQGCPPGPCEADQIWGGGECQYWHCSVRQGYKGGGVLTSGLLTDMTRMESRSGHLEQVGYAVQQSSVQHMTVPYMQCHAARQCNAVLRERAHP
jgi:hypothetical protein